MFTETSFDINDVVCLANSFCVGDMIVPKQCPDIEYSKAYVQTNVNAHKLFDFLLCSSGQWQPSQTLNLIDRFLLTKVLCPNGLLGDVH